MAIRINGTDIYTAYGAFIADDGYKGLFEWPESKPVAFNDWHDYDGIEVDLSALRLESHAFTLKFGILNDVELIRGFYAFLTQSPTLSFEDTDLELTRTLRVDGMTSVQHALTFQIMVVRFVCDEDILDGYERDEPVPGPWADDNEFRIDGVNLTDYGVKVLMGTLDSVLKQGDVKKSLLRSPSTNNGSEYDRNPLLWDEDAEEWSRSQGTDTVRFTSHNVTLVCGMVSPSAEVFWTNYYAFLYDLIHQDTDADDILMACQRKLHIGLVSRDFPCYYKSMAVKEFYYAHGRVWFKFDLTLEITDSTKNLPQFLQTENGILVQTEDGYIIHVATS